VILCTLGSFHGCFSLGFRSVGIIVLSRLIFPGLRPTCGERGVD